MNCVLCASVRTRRYAVKWKYNNAEVEDVHGMHCVVCASPLRGTDAAIHFVGSALLRRRRSRCAVCLICVAVTFKLAKAVGFNGSFVH